MTPDPLATLTIPTARLLLRLFRAFEVDLLVHLAEAGHPDVRASHVNLLRHLDPDGMPMSALAHDAGLTRQAVSQLVKPLVERDLVAVEPDPADARVRRVVWTAHGREVLEATKAGVLALERRYLDALGPDRYHALRAALQDLLALHG